VRLSTAIEVAGFGALSVAAFLFSTIAGLLVLGVCLLVIGYATDDDRSALAVGRLIQPIVRRNAQRRVRRTARREARIGSKV